MRALNYGSSGSDVTALQVALNARAKARGYPLVAVDGDLGHETKVSSERVGRALGALEQTLQGHVVTVGLQRMIRWPLTRTPVQLARASSRASQWAQQQKQADAAKAKVKGNKVTGGTPHDRIVAGARAALALDYEGKRHSFYSQAGKFTANHAITGEKPGERSDCSQFCTGMCWSSGLPDPNGGGWDDGYTGTFASDNISCSLADADVVIWDPYGPQGHMAVVEDRVNGLCIGHGSQHVLRHAISDFAYKGPPHFFKVRT